MEELLKEYLPILIFIGISLIIGLALLVSPFIVAFKNPDPEKLSAYECGFNAFDDARMPFDVRFYLVAILFIIFDLEVAFLFPWAVSFGDLGMFGFVSMMIFLAILTVGFVYEWKKGALEWD
ncbi:NADH-quinone oxidoreductase subunit A [Cohaesibacter haloalkalitolerans]|jgi:NADH-quinone oxidoreductase subunit A|uniref:NADH-quinone oxidoreductase subunit A n=1 Tax=Cohaesibacter haloalkalitolerans TaxID=1162980 RepID=UPI000E653ABE|nr:NADH-quinone oxidoreductase subunit A [Cohaesibacter haloalkalitolerans]